MTNDDDASSSTAKKRVTILHLDLGIGGAERLIVNIATSLLALNYDVSIYTSHHDISHCFEETKPNTGMSLLFNE